MARSYRTVLPVLLCLIATVAVAQTTTTTTTTRPTTTTTTASAATSQPLPPPSIPPEDGQWTMPAKNYQQTRFSGLDQINTSNVKDLKVAWTFTTGVNRGHEAVPLVVGDTMYIITPYPNVLYALDLKNSGAQKWKYEPKPAAAAQGVACCDVVNRGCFFDNGKIYFNTLDCNVCCVDASTGKEVWKTPVGDINIGESMTMAPLVAKGKVFVGNSGGEFGVRGWLKCLDANSGKQLWTAYSSGPDSECLIGEKFKPFYDSDKGKDLGVKTWPADHWKLGGGTVWGWVSYDPASNLIFYGMSNPGCWNPAPGDNKWSAGVFARDADTGQAVWYYQYNPHDLWDHDEINEHIVLDLPIDGQQRKIVVHPGRNGYMYVIDRTNGQVLSATPFVRITASHGVDLKTGRLIANKEKEPKTGKIVHDVQPAAPGAKDWQPCAWSPKTNLLYVPHQNLSCDFEPMDVGYIAGTPFVGAQEKMYAGADDPEHRGYFTAWDVINKKQVWRKKEKFPVWSGAVATAGDVVFYGTMEGWFKALDAKSGEELWKFKCGSGIIGQPITYKGPDGKQYVAILSGVGGWSLASLRQ